MRMTTCRAAIAGILAGLVVAIVAFLGIGAVAGSGSYRHLTMDLYMRGTEQWQDLAQPPQPAERNLVGSDLYELGGTDAAPVPDGDRIGRRVAACTVVTVQEAVCSAIIDLKDRGTLAAQLEVLIPGGNQGIVITGGTGEFAAARGTITEVPAAGHPNDRVLTLDITYGDAG